MSNLPPPGFGEDGGGPPPGFAPPSFGPPEPSSPPSTPSTQQYQPQPAPGSGNNRKVAIIAGLAVVAAAAAGGIYLATSGDDNGSEKTDETIEFSVPDRSEDTIEFSVPDRTEPTIPDVTVAQDTTPNIVIPEISIPEFTIPHITIASSTDVPEDTNVAIPEGAIDLSHGVYVPLPEGWEQTSAEGEVLTISSDTSAIALQVLVREPAGDPVATMQEYVDTFDADYPAVAYTTGELIDTIQGSRPVNLYRLYYRTYDANDEDGKGVSGGIYLYMRSDGLTMVYDVYGSGDDIPGLEGDELTSLETSFAAAPEIAEPEDLIDLEPFRIASVTPFAEVDGLTGFHVAPGFSIVNAGNGNGFVSNGTYDFSVQKLAGQADIDAAVATAQAMVAVSYPTTTYGTPSIYDPDDFGVIRRGIGWGGTYVDGRASKGAFDLFFDPQSGNGYVVFRSWFTDASDPTIEPTEHEADFMFSSFIESFGNIP